MNLEGRGAVITGGGRGIGAALARSLTDAGAAVVVAARTESQIEALAAELREGGARAWAVGCDVADAESVQALAKASGELLGTVDILLNNAGIAGSAALGKLTLAEWNQLFAVNATGTFLCTQALTPGMVERGWGRVINVASVAGLTGARYIAAYSASKHAVLGFTRSIADELAGRGVTVNALCPGFVDTEMTQESMRRIMSQTGLSAEDAMAAMLATTNQERLITPEEVAGTALWLCGPTAAGVNGQAIVIDGGGFRA